MNSGNNQTLCRHESSDIGTEDWSGDNIALKLNGKTIDTLPKGFKNFKHCIFHSNIDLVNDQIIIEQTNEDEVCITSLKIEFQGQIHEILVGKENNKSSFWIGDEFCFDDFISTRQVRLILNA